MIRYLFLFLCAAFFFSCGSSRVVTDQLILFFDPPLVDTGIEKQPTDGYPFKVQIKDLELGRLCDNAGVIIRSGDNTVQFSKTGLWAVRPNITASDLLQQVLKKNIKFKSLKERYSDSSPDYSITGSLENIEEDFRKPENRSAMINITLQIVRIADDQIVFEKSYFKSSPVKDMENYGEFAKELSTSLSELYSQFINDAIRVFNQELLANNAKNNGKD